MHTNISRWSRVFSKLYLSEIALSVDTVLCDPQATIATGEGKSADFRGLYLMLAERGRVVAWST